MLMKMILITLVFVLFVAGCSWDNEEDLFPEVGICDTLDMSFASDVVHILSN